MTIPAHETSREPIGFSESPRAGIRFTERMTGSYSTDPAVWDDYELAREQGERDGSALELILTVSADDLASMLSHPAHPATLTGSAIAPKLSRHALTLTGGLFDLFVEDRDRVETREMRYRGAMISPDDKKYYFYGFKRIQNDRGFDLWADTTTLYITIYDGDSDIAPVLGKGIVKVSLADFLRQLATLRATNVHRLADNIDAISRFLRFFLGVLRDTYGRVFARSRYFDHYARPREKRALRVPAPESHDLETGDGVRVRLTRYQGGVKGPVILAPGFGMSSLSFTIDTIPENLVECLWKKGYDVWVFDYRASPDLEASRTQFTIDDIAAHDWPAAVKRVHSTTGKAAQVVAHCVGAMSFVMAMLDGRLDGLVRFAVCSQLGAHPTGGLLNELKAGVHLGTFLSFFGLKTLRVTTDATASRKTRCINKVLKLYPTGEPCNNPVCRRIWFVLGESYTHAQLNQTTHDAIHEMFGEASLRALRHIARMLRRDYIVDKDGNDRYLPNVHRLNIPITFLHGAENRIFPPEGTEETFDWLREHNGENGYKRCVIEKYAHLDFFIGKNAHQRIFPIVLEELEAHP